MSVKQSEQDITAYLINRCAIRSSGIKPDASLPDDLGIDVEDAADFAEWYSDHFRRDLPVHILSAMLDGPPPAFLWLLSEIFYPGAGFSKRRMLHFEIRSGVTIAALARYADDPQYEISLGRMPTAMTSPLIRSCMQLAMLWAFFLIVAQFQANWNGMAGAAVLSLIVTGVVWVVVQPFGFGMMQRWCQRFDRVMKAAAQ